MHPDQLLYSVGDAAQALGVSRSTVYALVADGSLPSVRVRSARRITRSALEAFVAGLPDIEPSQSMRPNPDYA